MNSFYLIVSIFSHQNRSVCLIFIYKKYVIFLFWQIIGLRSCGPFKINAQRYLTSLCWETTLNPIHFFSQIYIKNRKVLLLKINVVCGEQGLHVVVRKYCNKGSYLISFPFRAKALNLGHNTYSTLHGLARLPLFVDLPLRSIFSQLCAREQYLKLLYHLS